VEAHTNVDIIVDIPQLTAMLDARLPAVLAGTPVHRLRSVWPSADINGTQPWNVKPGLHVE
jgi:hypothetical protein